MPPEAAETLLSIARAVVTNELNGFSLRCLVFEEGPFVSKLTVVSQGLPGHRGHC